jgi:NADPH-dependent 2,4-dienoyl-CoA reductase/sulfur reductase-like enzyme
VSGPERLVVVGGDAAGMSAASQAKRLRGDDLEVVVVERGGYTSYSACGIPYWIGGEVDGPDGLIARTPEEHRDNGLDVRMHTEALSLDLDRREIEVRALEEASTYRLGFDQLVIATGATPVVPDWPVEGGQGFGGGGRAVDEVEGLFGVQTLDDGQRVIEALKNWAPKHAVVIGGGYIGVEMAEAMVNHGLEVTVVDQAPEPMSTLDPDMGRLVHRSMQALGITVLTSTKVESLGMQEGRVHTVRTAAGELTTDLVVMGIGVRPNTAWLNGLGLPAGRSGGLRTDLQMRLPGFAGLWAGGDCVETRDLVAQEYRHVPLGTHANKQGRVIGTNIGGGYATFPGVVGTAVSKVCDLEIARTGLTEKAAAKAGYEFVVSTVESTTRAGYYPDAQPLTVKMLAEKRTGRLLGAQIVGREGAAKRIDACAVALWKKMSVEEMAMLDLSYAPPFAPVWDPVLIAARKLSDVVRAEARGDERRRTKSGRAGQKGSGADSR